MKALANGILLSLLMCVPSMRLLAAAPYTHTKPATRIRSNSAMLDGMAVPNGEPAAAWFEWGTNRNYGTVTSATNVGSGAGVVRVAAPVTDLVPGGRYHFRLVVSNTAGVVFGADQQFVTGSKVTAWGRNDEGQLNLPAGLDDAVFVAGGSWHSLVLKSDGSILAWGNNSYHQRDVPVALSDAVAISAGNFHNLALRSNGTVVGWGKNEAGETNVPTGLNNAIAIGGGYAFSEALKADGSLCFWGDNSWGQTNAPPGLSNVVAIAVGGHHSLALTADGSVLAWGLNWYGQTNVPPGLSNVIAIAAGYYHSLALQADGRVICWGDSSLPPANLSNVIAIAAGGYGGNAALQANGTVVVWGANDYGQANVPALLNSITGVALGTYHTLALANQTPQANSQTISGPANLDMIVTLSASDTNGETLAFRVATLPTTGALFQYATNGRGGPITANDTWVSDPSGRVVFAPAPNEFGSPYASFSFVANDGDVDSTPATVTISLLGTLRVSTQQPWATATNAATLNGMVLPNGFPTVAWYEWGTNSSYGQATAPVDLGDGGTVVRLAEPLTDLLARTTYHCRLVASNLTGVVHGADRVFSTGKRIAAWGGNTYGQATPPAAVNDATVVAAGWYHSVALRADGTVAAWGQNLHSQTNVPAGVSNIVTISAEAVHSLALKADGTVVAWGEYYYYGYPNPPPELSNVVAIASGQEHDLALKADGTVVAWGQTTVPTDLSNVVAIAASSWRSLAMKADGTVVAWGDNYSGWLTPPVDLSNVVAIATGSSHSLALKANGTCVAWGDNSSGQTNVPAGLSGVVAIACGYHHNLALKADGTLVAWGTNSAGQISLPAGLVDVTAMSAGESHSLAVAPNVPPVAFSRTVSGPLNQDLVITLSGADANGDTPGFRIVSLPGAGSLYQFASGSRGARIFAGDAVTDPSGRLFFVPVTDQFGKPYASFNFVAHDGAADSPVAAVTVLIESATAAFAHAADRVTGAGARLNGVAIAGHLPTTVWFEWGPDRNYGSTTAPVSLAAGSNMVWLSDSVSGLAANAVYHCRLVASNSGGVACSANRVFTTGRKPTMWGNPNNGEHRVPAGLTNVVAMAAGGNHVLVLKNDRTLAAWGNNFYQQTNLPAAATNIVAIDAGDAHSLALRADGSVLAWGDNSSLQTAVPPGLTDIKSIAAGGAHSLVLRSNGTVVAWGWNQYGQTNVPASLTNAVAIAAGDYHSLALKSDGRVVAWGTGAYGYGQTNVPATLSNAVVIWATCCVSRAIRIDGSVVSWASTNLQPDWTNVLAFAGLLALKSDNTVSSAPESGYYGLDDIPPGLTNVAAIGMGNYYGGAIGNTPPTPIPQSVKGPANHDLVIQLTGTDPQEDSLNFRIASLPAAGNLYQYTGGTRGTAITLADTLVNDAQGRVIFAPASDGFGSPYTSFNFLANDGEIDSTQAVVTVNLVGQPYAFSRPAAPVGPTNGTMNAMVVPNGFPTTVWFEWGATPAYDRATPPADIGAGSQVVRVTAPIEGLASNAVVHFRVVASNRVSVVFGADQLLTTGRRLVAWGGNGSGQTNVSSSLKGVTGVFADADTSYALRTDGRVTAYGFAQTNVLAGIPAGLSNVISVGRGIALKADGTVAVWGSNFYGETNVPPGLSNVVEIANGHGPHHLVLRADGTVVAWGYNNHGETNVPAGLSNVVAVSSGNWFNAALKADGTVVAWGGTLSSGVETNVPPGLSNVVAITSGDFHSLALKSDGRVVMWGDNSNGSESAVVPSGLSNVVAVACGYFHNLALKADGSLVMWGFNVQGALSVPPDLNNVAAIAAGSYHSVALRPDRAPSAAPAVASGTANQDLVVLLSGTDPDGDALQYRLASLPAQGTLYQYNSGSRGAAIIATNTWVTGGYRVIFAPVPDTFGSPYAGFGYLANDGELDSPPVQVTLSISGTAYAATLPASSIGLTGARMNGMAVANGLPTSAWFEWGTDAGYGQATAPVSVSGGAGEVYLNSGLIGLSPNSEYHFRLVVSNATRIAVGSNQRFKTGGRITSWGLNTYNVTNIPSGLTNVLAVAGGGTHSLALRTDGTVRAWGGGNAYDGGVGATNVPAGLSNVIAIAAGNYFSLGLRSNATVAAWGGYQYSGGVPPYGETNVPVSLTNAVAISAGGYHALALRVNGTVTAWGSSSYGQTYVPYGLSNVVAIAAGGEHSLALKIDGTVAAWGRSDAGQASPPAGLSNVIAVAAGLNHSLALRADGTLIGWGNSANGLASTAAALSNVVKIAAGGSHNLALKTNGALVCWGSNTYHQTNVPAGLVSVVEMDGGASHSLALGADLPPQAVSQICSGPANADLVIHLSGYDGNGDWLSFRMVTLPGAGTLYQYVGGTRGDVISAANLAVGDSQGQVIFAPETNAVGSPYTSFSFRVNDGELDSAPAVVTLHIVVPSAPQMSAVRSKWRTDGLFELNFTGQSNGVYRVWASTNLIEWEVLGRATATSNGWFNYLDTSASNWPWRFYRAGAP
jgi:alpha-tubulin suppressor-like RCC1 family protein